MVKSILIIITRAPYGRENVHASLYTAIASLDEDTRVTVVLVGDGVYSALRGQVSEKGSGVPSVEDLIYALFPGSRVVADGSSLEERGVKDDDLAENVEILPSRGLLKLIFELGEAVLVY